MLIASRAGLVGQVQLFVFVHQMRRDAELAAVNPLDLLSVPTDEPLS